MKIVGDVASIGECMVELAPTEDGLFRQGFAGDTLNTAWYIRALAPAGRHGVRYLSAVGIDDISDRMLAFQDELRDQAHAKGAELRKRRARS